MPRLRFLKLRIIEHQRCANVKAQGTALGMRRPFPAKPQRGVMPAPIPAHHAPLGNAVKDFSGLKIRNLRGPCRQRRYFGARKTCQTPQFTAKNPSRRCPLGLWNRISSTSQGVALGFTLRTVGAEE